VALGHQGDRHRGNCTGWIDRPPGCQRPGGRGIRADYEVTVFEPTSRYAFKVIAGPVRPVGEYRFAPSPNGTQVTFSLSAELRGLKRLLLARQVQNSMRGDVASLDRAKALIESS
jgi:Polyketide cyclase / dehydrase and lipid transport